jgi:predicted nicotinamide N-methyase
MIPQVRGDSLTPPSTGALARVLDTNAPFVPVPMVPGLRAFTATSLVGLWEAAEALAGHELPAPFWAWPWAAGIALARTISDAPDLVRGRRVLDFGAGGGVSSIACALAGAARVVANDVDPWALAVTTIAAERHGVNVEVLHADLAARPELALGFDVVLCGDLAYDRSTATAERGALEGALRSGSRVFVADAGRTYFDPGSSRHVATWDIDVPMDLEGRAVRTTRVYELSAE